MHIQLCLYSNKLFNVTEDIKLFQASGVNQAYATVL